MNANHLVIGLGGTGGKIIRAFRKTIFQEFRKENADDVNLAYLYVDSSDEMMGLDDPSWKILGTSLQLNKKSQLLIQEANLNSRLENIDNYPGIKPWIGNPEQWKDILGSIIGVTLGGQKRRLGRFLFACKALAFKSQVQSLVKDLQAAGGIDVTFHICCGLAGGTGSGSVIDVLAQLRDTYPDSRRYRIILYALLPETYPNPSWDTGNYHANGYAALLELNALSTGRFEPTDITGEKGRLKVSDPFNGCYLLTNENENGLPAEIDKEVPNIVGDFLYQKIVAVRHVSWPTLGRMENAENGDGTPERAASTNIPERSKRFLAFGIKRLAIPEQEISEFLTYNFARQAALQLRFNNWSDSSGFIDEPRNSDFHQFVEQKDTQFKWGISDEHITLSLGILPEDAANTRWNTIANEWQNVMPNFKSVVREKDRKTWLDELAKLCEKRFDQDYRALGVRNFYSAKLKSKKDHAREMRRRVEIDLFDDWRNGAKSAYEAGQLLVALIDSTEGRWRALDNAIEQARKNEEQAATTVTANNRQWSHMGFLDRVVLGAPDNLFNAQADSLREQYTYRTRVEALGFAKRLLEEFMGELNNLKSEVDLCASTLSEAAKKYNERLAQRINDQKTSDLREQLVRFYSPEIVRTVTKSLVKNEDEQKTQSSRVRAAIISKLGDHPGFPVFNERLHVSELLDVLDRECANNARVAHNNLIQNSKDKLLGVSIIGKLKERFGSNLQELRSYVTDLVSAAGNYLSFDPSEAQKASPGIPAGVQTAVSKMSILMPRAPEDAEFSARLKEAFMGARSSEVEIIETDLKPNEIVLVSLTNLFPLRYVRQVAFLKQKYEQRLASPSAQRMKIELHTEGDGSQFPRIFVPLQEDVRKEAIPYLLLGKVLNILQQTPNDAGTMEWVMVTKDKDGFDTDPIFLGKIFSDAVTKLDSTGADLLQHHVNDLLNTPEFTPEAKRTDAQRAVVAAVEAIKAERGGNLQDEAYRRYLEGGRKAVAILKREN